MSVNRLRNSRHFKFHQEFIDLVNRYGAEALKIKPLFERYMKAFARLDDAEKKIIKSIITEQIQNADKARDNVWRGLVDSIMAAIRHFDPQVQLAAKKLQILVKAYKNLARKPFHDETADIYNVLQEFHGKYAADVAKVGIDAWVAKLEELNIVFDNLMKERYNESAARCDVAIKEARAEINKLYNSIVNCINAFIDLEGIEEYEEFVKTWNTIILKFKAGRKSSSLNPDTPDSPDLQDGGTEDLEELGT